MEPANFGKYPVERLLKRGGMASVYLAEQPGLKRQVAIKVLHLAHDDDLRQRFLREMAIIGQMRHPHIVTVHDADFENSEPFLVMEYIRGQNLREVIERRPEWSLQRKLRIVDELAQGLVYAHSAGVIHRDIKPANVMLDAEGTVKVVDFGIARTSDSDLTQVGAMLGTPTYAAPEQLTGDPVDERTDVFGVGTVAYELISYEKAFDGANSVLHVEPVPLARRCPWLSPAVADVIMRALMKDPDARHRDAAHFLMALREAFSVAGYSPADSDTWPTPRPDFDLRPTVVSPSTARRARQRQLAALAGVLALSVALVALWQIRPGQATDSQAPQEGTASAPEKPFPTSQQGDGGPQLPPQAPSAPLDPPRGPSEPPPRSSSGAAAGRSPAIVATVPAPVAKPPDLEPTAAPGGQSTVAPPVSPQVDAPRASTEAAVVPDTSTGRASEPVPVVPMPAPAEMSAQDDRAQIATLVERWAAAMSRRDVGALQEMLSDSQGTRPEVRLVESWRVVVSNPRTTFEQSGQRARVRAGLAYEEMVIGGRAMGRAAGSLAMTLEKRPAGWRIVELRTEVAGR